MTWWQLLRRNLLYYWRTNLAVVLGVAVAVAVLAGALLVGDSVRASLRDLVLLRLGATAYVVTSQNFFREELAAGIAKQPGFSNGFRDAAPLIALDAVVTHAPSKRRASGVLVYGVDDRFWKFQGQAVPQMETRDALVSASLASELGAAPGDAILIRVEKRSAVPVESLHSQKDDLGRTLRLRVRQELPADALGEFSVRPQQGAVKAVFLPLDRLQRELGQAGHANTILISESHDQPQAGGRAQSNRNQLEQLLRESFALSDLGVRVSEVQPPGEPGGVLSVESEQILLDDRIADAADAVARELVWKSTSLFTYLANSIRVGEKQIPYSLVTALDGAASSSLSGFAEDSQAGAHPPIWFNDWAWRELSAKPGDVVALDYYVWHEGGRLETRTAEFTLRGRVPMEGLGGDRRLAPTFPGISESPTLGSWNPPFPVDLKRIRPRDEDYWERYRTAPKAFLRLADGQALWQSRYGKLTGIRLHPSAGQNATESLATVEQKLRAKVDPVAAGMVVYAARAEGTQASQGAVDFSLYFVSFSFFLVLSAALLASLFFRLGIEQRLKEIGLLEAFGYSPADVRRLFLREGLALAAVGGVLGAAGAAAYSALMIYGLRTWWVDAVGTTFLRSHVAPASLLIGVAGGFATAVAGVLWTLRGLRSFSPRSLVTGSGLAAPVAHASRRKAWLWGTAAVLLALVILALAWKEVVQPAGGFFGAGGLLLAAFLSFQSGWLGLKRRSATAVAGVARMGVRNASWRPGRSLLCIGMMASATFILVSVDAFRRDARSDTLDPRSGTGGFALVAESLLPIPYDLNMREGQEKMGLGGRESAALKGAQFFSFRLRPGEDASCLNLYQPRNPRVMGVPEALVQGGRFTFGTSLAESPEQRGNPWSLLGVEFSDGAVPAIADANSMTYILQKKLGEDLVLEHDGRPVRLRLVAALSDSLFQSELLISEKNFVRLFPHEPGYRFFLIQPPKERSEQVATALEEGLADSGFDVTPAGQRLETFHRVENTYISTFQALGGLGLLLGTLGLAAVMLRNVLERRREMALLRATGFRTADLARLVVAENSVLLFGGLASGIVSAMVAILPALAARGGAPGGGSLGFILVGVVLVGLMTSVVAVAAAVRTPLLAALRSE